MPQAKHQTKSRLYSLVECEKGIPKESGKENLLVPLWTPSQAALIEEKNK